MMILINSIFIILISLIAICIFMYKMAKDRNMSLHELARKDDDFIRNMLLSLYKNNPSIYYLLLFIWFLFIVGVISFIIGLLYIIIF